jgi:ribosomal protein S18 acetylase RimI-like enzyme
LEDEKMKMEIVSTRDANLLSRLNHDVQEIHHEIEPEIFKPFDQDHMETFFQKVLENSSVKAYIAKVDEIPAGYMLLAENTSVDNPYKYACTILHIDQICVESEFKGKGVGKALVDYAKQYAVSKQIKRIEMNYWTQNTNSGEFFRSQGFVNFNERLFINVE